MRRLAGHAQPHSAATRSCSQCGLRRRAWLISVGVHPAVDPAAARGRAVGLQLGVRREGSAVGAGAVDLAQHRLTVGLAEVVDRVVPGQVEQRPVHLVGGVAQLLADPVAQLDVELQLAGGVARRVDRLVAPLQHPLGLGERAGLLGVRGGGQEEDLGPDLLGDQLAGLDLRAVLPERRRLDHLQVADDEPVEVGQAEPLHLAVGRADRGVLPHQEVALAAPLDLRLHGRVRRVVTGQPRQVVEAEVVLGGGGVAPVRLQQAHGVRPDVAPEAGLALVVVHPLVHRLVLVGVGHRDVARQDVEQGRDVGRALDRRVPAQRQDAAAGPTDVAEQGLQDRGGADDLRADAVVGPADGVAERRRALASAVAGERVGDLREVGRRDAADLLHHLGGVAGEVPLEDLEDAVRVLQRLVAAALPVDGCTAGAVALRVRGLVGLLCGRRSVLSPAPRPWRAPRRSG